jgi:hypothetical protein
VPEASPSNLDGQNGQDKKSGSLRINMGSHLRKPVQLMKEYGHDRDKLEAAAGLLKAGRR